MPYGLLNHPEVYLRKFAAGDIPAMQRIISKTLSKTETRRSGTDLRLLLQPVSRGRYPKGKAVRLADTKYTFAKMRVVAFRGRVIGLGGVCRLDTHPDDVLEVDWFAIDPRYQRNGLGTKFMKWMISEAKRGNNKILFVWSTAEAEPFYKKFGFRRSRMRILPMETRILLVKKIQ